MAFSLSFLFHLIISLFYLLNQPIFSTANNLQKTKSLFNSQLLYEHNEKTSFLQAEATPTTYFEVTKPIQLPKTKPCSNLILEHDFGFTYGRPPVIANYTPPSNCPSQKFSKIVFEWKATSKGRQFDRIFGVWLGGVEIFRSCTAEPRPNGIVWAVEKDITRYYSLLMSNQTLAVYLGNLIDKTYTGIYHVNISVHFYPAEENYGFSGLKSLDDYANSWADLILPISRNLPLNDGLWFEIESSTDVESKEFKIPPNVYKATLEVYVSFHENDEFWYGNFPNEYIVANNLTGTPGNGPFREVLVSLDDVLVGSVWPFTVVYTGGINPLLWRPISGIGSFDLPTYDIEITPFLGKILDGKTHRLGFSVTNALNVWYIDTNLHLWLDKKSEKTEGKVLKYNSIPLTISSALNFTGLDGSFFTNASRTITSEGWVKSSYGTIITKTTQGLKYSNFMVLGNQGNRQIVNQTIEFNDMVSTEMPSSVKSTKSLKIFPFYLYTDTLDQANGSYVSVSNVTLGFNEKKIKKSDQGLFVSSLENLQKGNSIMLVKGNLVIGGLGTTKQAYSYKDNEFCYFRNVGSSNYTILYDKVGNKCSERRKHNHLRKRLLPS